MIPGVLIAQNADHPAAAEQTNRLGEASTTIEQFHAETRALAPNEFVDAAIAQFLEDGSEPDEAEMMRQNLREQFPIPEMAQRQHHRSARAQMPVHLLGAFCRHERRDLLQRHRIELYPSEQIRAQPLKMPAH